MIVFSSVRMIIRQQAYANLSTSPEKALTVITIQKTDRIVIFKGRRMPEIKVDGKMYDIVRQKDNGSSISYYCLRDRKEEQLIHKAGLLTDQSKNNNPLSKTANLILDQIIKTALLLEKQGLKEPQPVEFFFHCKNHIYSGPLLPVLAPPPQQFC